jgi:ABC-2 type transport system permease protein
MKKVFAIAWNDIKIEFSERATIIFYLILPIVFTAIIGIGLSGSYGQSTTINLPVVDEDKTSYAQQLKNTLSQDGVVSLAAYDTLEKAKQDFNNQSYPAILIIPQGFGVALENGQPAQLTLIEQTSDEVMSVEQSVQSAAGQLGSAIAIANQSTALAAQMRPFANDAEQQAYRQANLDAANQALSNPPAHAELVQGNGQNVAVVSAFKQSAAGQLVTWVLITLLGGSEVFVNERVGGTLKRLLTTPSSKATIITGKIVGRFLLGAVQMALLVGFGALVFKINWGQDPLALTVILAAFALAGTALGVMLGAFARTSRQAGGLSVMFSLLLAALGGAWWPMEITPAAYQAAVKVLPSTWAMSGLTDVVTRGQGLTAILPQTGILLGFAVVFFAIGVWKLKFE